MLVLWARNDLSIESKQLNNALGIARIRARHEALQRMNVISLPSGGYVCIWAVANITGTLNGLQGKVVKMADKKVLRLISDLDDGWLATDPAGDPATAGAAAGAMPVMPRHSSSSSSSNNSSSNSSSSSSSSSKRRRRPAAPKAAPRPVESARRAPQEHLRYFNALVKKLRERTAHEDDSSGSDTYEEIDLVTTYAFLSHHCTPSFTTSPSPPPNLSFI